MVFGFRSDAGDRLERIEEAIQQRFRDDAHSVDLAMSAVVFLTLVRVLSGRGGSRRGVRPARAGADKTTVPA